MLGRCLSLPHGGEPLPHVRVFKPLTGTNCDVAFLVSSVVVCPPSVVGPRVAGGMKGPRLHTDYMCRQTDGRTNRSSFSNHHMVDPRYRYSCQISPTQSVSQITPSCHLSGKIPSVLIEALPNANYHYDDYECQKWTGGSNPPATLVGG
jgi:hypothetical protein